MRNPINHLTTTQQVAYAIGLLAAALCATLLLSVERWRTPGPSNIGHSRIGCTQCHAPAAGHVAGQLLNNALYAMGLAESERDFIYRPAGTEQCLNCHHNPDDRHPVADFTPAEFSQARRLLNVQSCLGCHQEHSGGRVNVTPLVCRYCHQETALEEDPLDIAHATLIDAERWETCLGCHDFHGNHEHEAPTALSETLSAEQIQQYFDGGDSPYGFRRLSVIQTMRWKK